MKKILALTMLAVMLLAIAVSAQAATATATGAGVTVIKAADWVIDLGPEAGDGGGHLVYSGTPEKLYGCAESYTARYL